MNAASLPNNAPPEARPRISLLPLCDPTQPEHGNPAPPRPAIGGVAPFSSVDWPGMLTAVIFVAGCPWRCFYCHNPHLQQRHARYDWTEVCEWLQSRRGLLDGVVFSGGEPLSEIQLPQMMETVRAMGFKIALHSAGVYPERLAAVLPLVDWIGLDIKTNAPGYDALTGRVRSHTPADISLQILLDAHCEFECRTTWSPAWLSEFKLLDLAHGLAERGVRQYAVQNHRSTPGAPPSATLSTAALRELDTLFEHFEYR